MFVIISMLLTLVVIFELLFKYSKLSKILFHVFWLVMTIMLMFRYAQGSDYIEYKAMYDLITTNDNLCENILEHGEYGWYIVMVLAKRAGISFFMFNALLSLLMMIFTYNFIKEFANFTGLSLLLLYPTYYLTYYYSAMRQGFVLSVFLFISIYYLYKKEYLKYYTSALILSQIHISAAIFLIIPFGLKIIEKPTFLFICAIIFIPFFGSGYLQNGIQRFLHIGYSTFSVSYLAIIVRSFLFALALYLHYCVSKYTNNELEQILFKIYSLGFVIYITLCLYATLSQRITVYFKAVEIVLFPLQLRMFQSLIDTGKYRIRNTMPTLCREKSIIWIIILLVLICDVEVVKNIYSYMEQGNYCEWITPFDYPYFSVFDSQQEISKFKL